MPTYRIGIDLATINTGICIIDENDIVVYTKTITLKRFAMKNLEENMVILRNIIPWEYAWRSDPINKPLTVYIELSKYSMKTAQMFSFYAGAIYVSYCSFPNSKIKFIDPNKWQNEFCKTYGVEKIIKGSKSKKGMDGFHRNIKYYIYENTIYKNIKEVLRVVYIKHQGTSMRDKSQDEIDAYFIALFGEKTEGEFNGK